MRAFLVASPSSVRHTLIAAGGAVAVFLAGCAMQPLPDLVRTRSACRINSVLYCDVDVHVGVGEQQCRCIRSRELRDVLRSFSRP